ncbi:hypothetical protein E2562_031660 [Oryza meyeriana var. granulata]|uniref:Uncharacterized protein n=1 Tax=Oryza meyeriana var. granulata TaxID=110450 RepID=A0A6G1E4U5_9ORYZ|nr:hypothetical protein E2562_031660 [Oryza meyeriana var. granulata]
MGQEDNNPQPTQLHEKGQLHEEGSADLAIAAVEENMARLFGPLPLSILPLALPPPPAVRKSRPREKKEATRCSARQAARPSSVPAFKRVQGRLLKEMGFIEKEEALDDAVEAVKNAM